MLFTTLLSLATAAITVSALPTEELVKRQAGHVPAYHFAIHPNNDTTKCVGLAGPPGNNTPVVLLDCNGYIPGTYWYLNRGTTTIKTGVGNFSLDAGSHPANNVPAKIYQSYPNLPAQTWYYTNDNRLAVQGQGQCLDLPNGIKTNGSRLQTYKCTTGNTNQIWTLSVQGEDGPTAN